MLIPDFKKLNSKQIQRKYIERHYPDFYQYILNKYKHIKWSNFCEIIYLYIHGMDNRPKCKCCENEVTYINISKGYHKYCSVRCGSNDKETQIKAKNSRIKKYGVYINPDKIKQTKLEKYGDSNYNNSKKNQQTKLEKYGDPFYMDREKSKQTCIEKYGVENPMQNKQIKIKSVSRRIEIYGKDNVSNQKQRKQTCIEKYGDPNYNNHEKAKETCLKKYGKYYGGNTKKAKETCLKKYGVDNYSKTNEFLQKSYNTKKENGTFNSSSIEKLFEKWLIDNKINYISQYQSDEYPFNCDFYFPDKNLYLEIQGFWGHGDHPYDPENVDDVKIADSWKEKGTKFYLNNYDVWTRRDPLKRQWAKDHNLNWKEIFTCKLDELLGEIKDLIL